MAIRRLEQLGRIAALLRNQQIYQTFFTQHYQSHNIARLEHLDSLALSFRGKHVLEVGAGIGDHTLFYLYRGAQILPTDGRPDLVDFIRHRFGLRAEVFNAETEIDKLQTFGRFDILHCYGFLYHISNPVAFLKHAAKVADCLLLETCVSFGHEDSVNIVKEAKRDLSQAISGHGCRPTREWVFHTLQLNYEHVYVPKTQPHHREFPLDWGLEKYETTMLTRAVFLASHRPIENSSLLDYLPLRYEEW